MDNVDPGTACPDGKENTQSSSMGNIGKGATGRVGMFKKHLKGDEKDKEWKIVYTYTDEAPLLATYSLLPVINRFTIPYGVAVEPSDISVAHRVLALFSDKLSPDQKVGLFNAVLCTCKFVVFDSRVVCRLGA